MLLLFMSRDDYTIYQNTGLLPSNNVFIEELEDSNISSDFNERMSFFHQNLYKKEYYRAWLRKVPLRDNTIGDIIESEGQICILVNGW
jgi:hypothetical protein